MDGLNAYIASNALLTKEIDEWQQVSIEAKNQRHYAMLGSETMKNLYINVCQVV